MKARLGSELDAHVRAEALIAIMRNGGVLPTRARPTNVAALAAAAPPAGTEMQQQSVASMFGARGVAKSPAAYHSDLKKWDYEGIGGEEKVPQKQVLSGPVTYMVEIPPKHAKLLAVGSD